MRRVRIGMAVLGLMGCNGDAPADGALPPDGGSDGFDTDTGVADPDGDGDGFGASVDCDDADPDIHPDAVEICDGIDNDCNADIDDADAGLDPASTSVFYADTDADGFGDPLVTEMACAPPKGYVVDGTDCDDLLSDTHPGALERCDGSGSDCDPATAPSGATFQDTLGAVTSQTAAFAAGTALNPASLSFPDAGVLSICEGTWFVGLNVSADLEIVGAGSATTILDGGDRTTGVRIGNGSVVSVSGLTLTRFSVDGQLLLEGGSALSCQSGSQCTGDDLQIVNNDGSLQYGYGGAMSVDGDSRLTLSNSTFDDNMALIGGHAYIGHGTATFDNVVFRSGIAGFGGGAMLLGDVVNLQPATVTCIDCTFDRNEALALLGYGGSEGSGGAIWVFLNATLSLIGGSFTDNVAAGQGGAVVLQSYGLGANSADFDAVSFDGNRDALGPNDVSVPSAGLRYDYTGTTVTVSCDEQSGCL